MDHVQNSLIILFSLFCMKVLCQLHFMKDTKLLLVPWYLIQSLFAPIFKVFNFKTFHIISIHFLLSLMLEV